MLKNLLLIATLIIISTYGLAGSTGYVFEGKTYYIYKDGVALNQTPKEEPSRGPASVGAEEKKSDSLILHFTEDDTVRCYYWDTKKRKKSKKKRNSNIHCLKLSDLKEHP